MKKNITINRDSCILCRRCVTLCPSVLFAVNDGVVEVNTDGGCIACGQCVAGCPADAIAHEDFPANKVHDFDRASLPDGDELMTLIKSRRSNRAFSDKPIPADFLDKIVEAGRYAPTATNSREVRMLVVTDEALLRQISSFTIGYYISILKLVDNSVVRPLLKLFSPSNYAYISTFKRMKAEHERGNDQILHGAKAMILYYTPSGSRFGCHDANLAYQNSSLMAETLGVAHFYTGFVYVAALQGKGKLQKILGIDGTIQAGMALSMPAFKFKKFVER